MQDLSNLTISALVGVYNGLNPNAPLKSWKRSKDILVERIEDIRSTIVSVIVDTPFRPTIRATAVNLLCHVDYYEDRNEKSDRLTNALADGSSNNARSVGMAYDEVIRRIRAEFPDCQTTVACLRWYSVKIRVEEQGYEGLRLPQRRPRVKPSKKS